MSRSTKILVYAGLILCALVFAYSFGVDFTHVLHGAAGASKSRMIAALGAFVAVAIVLGLLCAYDVSRYFGRRAERWILQGGDPVLPAAELEEAEKLRKRGESLDAIRLLREVLQNYPDQLDLMSRIAEIYNYDLKNYLAAALEYEELLKHKLPDEKWGWAALHLAKLYGRLNEADKALALLERLETQYGHTLAARRARKVREVHSEEPGDAEAPLDSP